MDNSNENHSQKSQNTAINSKKNIKVNTRVQKSNTAQVFVWLFAMLMLFCGLFLGFSYGALSDSKTATGVISIELPPTLEVRVSDLYYDFSTDKMYLGTSTSGTELSASTTNTPKLVLSNTRGEMGAYLKIECSLTDLTTLGYDSTTSASFSDDSVLSATVADGVVSLSTSSAVEKDSYMYLDSVLSNLRPNESLTNATLQVKTIASLNAEFSNSSTSYIYYIVNSNELVKVTLPTDTETTARYIATAVTEKAMKGESYMFKVTMATGYDNTAPTVTVNGETLTGTNTESGVYTFTIASLQGGETIAVTPIINTYTITITPKGTYAEYASTVTLEIPYGGGVYVEKETINYTKYIRGGSPSAVSASIDIYLLCYRASSTESWTCGYGEKINYSWGASFLPMYCGVGSYAKGDVDNAMGVGETYFVAGDMGIEASWNLSWVEYRGTN